MSRHRHPSDVALADMAPNDERGTPDNQLVRCVCGTIHRVNDSYHAEVCDEVDAPRHDRGGRRL